MPDPLNLAFAELLKDPKASFPRAFTICSTAMASNMDTKTSSGYIALFTLTGLDDLPYLTGLYDKDQNGSFGLVSGTFYSKEEAEIPKVFPEQWLSSCIAVNTDTREEGVWRDCYTGELLRHNGSWFDSDCKDDMACLCDRKTDLYVRLRGLNCTTTAIDRLYLPKNFAEDFNEFVFMGDRDTRIAPDGTGWRISVLQQNNLTGVRKTATNSFPLGKSKWTIKGDPECFEGKPYNLSLQLTSCKEDKFTCDDGLCIPMEERCDQFAQCNDMSDERDCQVLSLDEGYNKIIPPMTSVDGKKGPVKVFISLDFLKIVDIAEEDNSIEIQLEITLKWTENRATYYNLKQDPVLNALPQKDISKLWLPEVIYENTDQKESTRLGDGNWEWKTTVVIKKEGNFTRSGLETVDEMEIFKGGENNLSMRQTYTHHFQCAFQLTNYPFDTQAALSVNLTTMLVMTTIFISKMESLPPTSDIRMIDIWLVFCQVVPFAEVLLLTAREYNRKGSEDGTDNDNDIQTLDKEKIGDIDEKETISVLVSKCTPSWKTLEGKVLPLVVVVCFFAYFGIAFAFYNNF